MKSGDSPAKLSEYAAYREEAFGSIKLKPCRLRKVHPEPVAAALISSSHLGRSVAEVFLDVALIDFGAACQAGAQGMAREQGKTFFFGEI